jgi:hypothetical protein
MRSFADLRSASAFAALWLIIVGVGCTDTINIVCRYYKYAVTVIDAPISVRVPRASEYLGLNFGESILGERTVEMERWMSGDTAVLVIFSLYYAMFINEHDDNLCTTTNQRHQRKLNRQGTSNQQ